MQIIKRLYVCVRARAHACSFILTFNDYLILWLELWPPTSCTLLRTPACWATWILDDLLNDIWWNLLVAFCRGYLWFMPAYGSFLFSLTIPQFYLISFSLDIVLGLSVKGEQPPLINGWYRIQISQSEFLSLENESWIQWYREWKCLEKIPPGAGLLKRVPDNKSLQLTPKWNKQFMTQFHK